MGNPRQYNNLHIRERLPIREVRSVEIHVHGSVTENYRTLDQLKLLTDPNARAAAFALEQAISDEIIQGDYLAVKEGQKWVYTLRRGH